MILDQLKSKLVEYQKSKDEFRLGALRYLLSEIQKKEIELRPQGQVLDDEIVFRVIKKEIKNHNKTIEMISKANRPDLVEKEKKEIEFLKEIAKLFPFDLESR